MQNTYNGKAVIGDFSDGLKLVL